MSQLKSEQVVIQSPMSFVGSAARAWKLVGMGPEYVTEAGAPEKIGIIAATVGLYILALAVIALWWAAIVCWYLIFGILVIPWRLLRRGSRKRKRDALRHQEMLDAARRK